MVTRVPVVIVTLRVAVTRAAVRRLAPHAAAFVTVAPRTGTGRATPTASTIRADIAIARTVGSNECSGRRLAWGNIDPSVGWRSSVAEAASRENHPVDPKLTRPSGPASLRTTGSIGRRRPDRPRTGARDGSNAAGEPVQTGRAAGGRGQRDQRTLRSLGEGTGGWWLS